MKHCIICFLVVLMSHSIGRTSKLNTIPEEQEKTPIFHSCTTYVINESDAAALWAALKTLSTQSDLIKDVNSYAAEGLLLRVISPQETTYTNNFFQLNLNDVASAYSAEYYSQESTTYPDVVPIQAISVFLYIIAEEESENLLHYKKTLKEKKDMLANLPALEATSNLLKKMHGFAEKYNSSFYQLYLTIQKTFPELIQDLQAYKAKRRIEKTSSIQNLNVSSTFFKISNSYRALTHCYDLSIVELQFPSYKRYDLKNNEDSVQQMIANNHLSPRGEGTTPSPKKGPSFLSTEHRALSSGILYSRNTTEGSSHSTMSSEERALHPSVEKTSGRLKSLLRKNKSSSHAKDKTKK